MTHAINRNISEVFIPYYHSVSVVSAQVQLQKKYIHMQPITGAVVYTCLLLCNQPFKGGWAYAEKLPRSADMASEDGLHCLT